MVSRGTTVTPILAPITVFLPFPGNIQDISLIEEQGQLILLVFSNAGHLYRHIVTAMLPQNNSIFLTNTINVPNPPTGLPVSFHYTPASKILFISYENSSWFGVVTPETFQLEGTTIEWRKIPSEHAFSCWQVLLEPRLRQ